MFQINISRIVKQKEGSLGGGIAVILYSYPHAMLRPHFVFDRRIVSYGDMRSDLKSSCDVGMLYPPLMVI